MRAVLSRSNSRRLLATFLAVGGLVFAYEATTFDLLPWGAHAGAMDPAAPVPGARLDFSATAYCKGTTTASGAEVRTGIAAADDDILPVGSVININTDSEKYNGVYTIMDTGPRVQGRLLDLYMWSCREALAFGRKRIQVTVLRLGWNPHASMPSLIERLFRRRERAAAATPVADVVTPAEATKTPEPNGEESAPALPVPSVLEVPPAPESESTPAPTQGALVP